MEVGSCPHTFPFGLLIPRIGEPLKRQGAPLDFLLLAEAYGILEQVCPDTHMMSLNPLQPVRWARSLLHFTDGELKLREVRPIPVVPC